MSRRFGQTVQLGSGGAAGPLAVLVTTAVAHAGAVSSFIAFFDSDGVCRSLKSLYTGPVATANSGAL
jgi:hypothetical protein